MAVAGAAKSGAGPDCRNCGDAVTGASCSAPIVSYTSADEPPGVIVPCGAQTAERYKKLRASATRDVNKDIVGADWAKNE